MTETKHNFFMQEALKQAKIALKKGEVPVGAVLVDSSGKILARGYNKIEKMGCQVAHAESIVIQKACKKFKDWRLDGCWLYVTLEPCLMCFGLIQLSRIKGLVFGANSEFLGAGLGCLKEGDRYKVFNKNLEIKSGLKEKESTDILKRFFKALRKKRKVKCEAEKRIS
jgi:tRNA(adenine34) deaminase